MVDEVNEVTEEQTEEVVQEIQDTEVESDEVDQPEPDVPAYEPNYAYKVYDEEREFEEWVRPFLTSKEVEDHFRSLHSQAGGFDTLKAQFKDLKEDYGKTVGQHTQVVDTLTELQHYLDNDLGAFFQKVNVDDEKIISYVKNLLEQKENPQLAQQALASRQSLIDSWNTSRHTEQLEAQNHELAAQVHDVEMNRAMTLPDVTEFKQQFESIYGAGSFQNEVDNYGKLYWQQNGHDTTPLDAVLKTMERWRPAIGQVQPKATEAAPNIVEAKKAQDATKPKGHIPNVGSGAVSESPTKRRFASIEDLKKHAKELEAQQA